MIQQDDEIRLKIVGTRVDKNDIVSEGGNPQIWGEFPKFGRVPCPFWGEESPNLGQLLNLGGNPQIRSGNPEFGWKIPKFVGSCVHSGWEIPKFGRGIPNFRGESPILRGSPVLGRGVQVSPSPSPC